MLSRQGLITDSATRLGPGLVLAALKSIEDQTGEVPFKGVARTLELVLPLHVDYYYPSAAEFAKSVKNLIEKLPLTFDTAKILIYLYAKAVWGTLEIQYEYLEVIYKKLVMITENNQFNSAQAVIQIRVGEPSSYAKFIHGQLDINIVALYILNNTRFRQSVLKDLLDSNIDLDGEALDRFMWLVNLISTIPDAILEGREIIALNTKLLLIRNNLKSNNPAHVDLQLAINTCLASRAMHFSE